MFEIRIHGRGGQGVVTAAELLSIAAFRESKHAQAFPSFGSERTGAPVLAFCRIDDKPIRSREPIAQPDALIIQDPTLLHMPGIFNGLRSDGFVLINSKKTPTELGLASLEHKLPEGHMITVPATELAMNYIGRPIPNAALLGAFAALTGVVSINAVAEAIRVKFKGDVAEKNILAATAASEAARQERVLEIEMLEEEKLESSKLEEEIC
ncbi:MAG: 2-oxoacid:acceptor oxidoreductase family protein [Bacteroidota bacterium]|nr:2-oxoacid:acceptor oxidoreductase family protein [Bacteroidota bacterium]MDP4232992.1 2-oxoacid:acceptor oxidoreductase family protein [Bacteroidota bacterium]MDP4242036.1 2-oxoacid:acceptor oxidoreductase family protein [Bacteroidota bacterium]MDP4286939.1 2-oxoacid:acceptor oxidoreductase family protein [Bacteroidota bacterium]